MNWILIIIGVIIVFYLIGKNKLKETDGKPLTNVRDLKTDKMFYYKKLQFLESINIIDNTKSIDTLQGRVEFIQTKLFNDLIEDSKKERYINDCQKAIDEFKTAYYDKTLNDYEVSLLIKPNMTKFKEFISTSIYKCFLKYTIQQDIEIKKLKQIASIEKRKEDIIKKGYEAKYLFKVLEIPDYGNLDKIEEIRKKYYSYQK